MPSVEEHARSIQDRALLELEELLRIPSVSTARAHRADLRRCAERIAHRLEEAGLTARLLETQGHPAVFGERPAGPGLPTVLVYGHYDVQPPEPLELWRNDPFSPTREGEYLVARGSSDDKGQLYALVKGVQAYLETRTAPEVNIKVLIEGEEEIGSPGLKPLIRERRELLACDVIAIADCSQFAKEVPAITYGLRGLAYLELRVRGPSRDLHSGSYGGAVANPANVLCRLLAACQGPFGRVAIPGFYDDVRGLEPWEREEFASLPFDEESFRDDVGAPRLWGEEGYTTLERRWARPTLDVHGLVSGFTEEGAKTVLPSEASAKLSMRLVPDQDPERILALTEDLLRSVLPVGVELEVVPHHTAKPVLVPRDGAGVRAAVRAYQRSFGRRPVFIREGGSIPVVNTFREELGVDSLLMGLGLPDDHTHAPNERLRIVDFQRGIALMGAFLEELGASREHIPGT